MPIVAKETSSNRDFIPAPAGVHAAVCCDVVDLGVLEVTFGGKTKKQHKVRIVWQIEEVMEDNKPYLVGKRYTLSLHEKAALRKDLESWRGRPFTQEELQGFDLEALIAAPALLNVVHNPGREGGVFANIASIMKLPKTMNTLKIRDYVRVCERAPEASNTWNGAVAPESPWPAEVADDDVPF